MRFEQQLAADVASEAADLALDEVNDGLVMLSLRQMWLAGYVCALKFAQREREKPAAAPAAARRQHDPFTETAPAGVPPVHLRDFDPAVAARLRGLLSSAERIYRVFDAAEAGDVT